MAKRCCNFDRIKRLTTRRRDISMTRFKTVFLNSIMVTSLAAGLTVSTLVAPAAADGFGSKIASTFSGFFKGNDEHRAPVAVAPHPSPRQTAQLVPAPLPQVDLLNDGERGGRIVKVQSKRELGAAINTNSRAIGENTIRVQELQEQMRQITGRVEQLVFDLQRIQEQLRIMQEDAWHGWRIADCSSPCTIGGRAT